MVKDIFIKIWKAATAYVVGSIALIQLPSVDRFHLPDEPTKNELIKLANTVFS